MVDKSLVSRQEAKIRELETRLEFEWTQVKRLEVGRCHLPYRPPPHSPRRCHSAVTTTISGPPTPHSAAPVGADNRNPPPSLAKCCYFPALT